MISTWGSRSRNDLFTKSFQKLVFLAVIVSCTACAQTGVRPLAQTAEKSLPLPMRILIYSVTADESEVAEYQGIMRQQPAQRDPLERRREIAKNVSQAITEQLVQGLRQFGFRVERVERHIAANDNDLIVDGRFISVDEGNPLRRWVVGFGSGAARVDTRVQLLRGNQRRLLLEFATQSDSGKLPGAVATLLASIAAPVGVGLTLTAASGVNAGLTANSTEVSRMAAASADQAVRYLGDFFAKQGWINGNQVKPPRFAY
ncbi:MAG TPA: DUF4410 domain-containing protein [Candidatus Saccharimonadales bacterium]|nr:DUF4410 domain-containing protein [Candidatus Saccharimonadales bacterium]